MIKVQLVDQSCVKKMLLSRIWPAIVLQCVVHICMSHTHCQTHSHTKTHTHTQTRATYPASARRWSCQIPRDRTPILWRSWPCRPPCAGSPTQPRQRGKKGGQRSDEIHLPQCVSSSSVMSHSKSHSWPLSSSRTKLNELINACSFTNE